MRIATYNVEWFTNLFDDQGRLLADGRWSGRRDVKRFEQLEALGVVFSALDADAVMIIEAPDAHRRRDGVAALETFADAVGLRARKAVMGFVNQTQQEIALLYDPDVLRAEHDPQGSPRFDGDYRIDLDVDAKLDKVRWSKPPLELSVTTKSAARFRMIGVHAKSKAPHGARNRKDATRIAIQNRRKQLAQCIWLRERVDDHLDAKEPLIVLGDFNDGPGLDEYEKLFGKSGVEIVRGGPDEVQLFDPHAEQALSGVANLPTSARFFLPHRDAPLETLLDYIMLSPELAQKAKNWRIWHPFKDEVCKNTPELRDALLIASDHFPVSVEIDM